MQETTFPERNASTKRDHQHTKMECLSHEDTSRTVLRATINLKRSRSVRFARVFCAAIFFAHADAAHLPAISATFHAAAKVAWLHWTSATKANNTTKQKEEIRQFDGACNKNRRNNCSSSSLAIFKVERSRRMRFGYKQSAASM